MSFINFPIKPQILKSLKRYNALTPVQEATMDSILKGRDILALAPTGSGKTLLFAIASLQNINEKLFKTQSLIISPTRDLAIQTATAIKELAKHIPNIKISTIIGGEKTANQIKSLRHRPHIIVATTGRLMAILEQIPDLLEHINTFAIDEIDKMVSDNFYSDIECIKSYLKNPYQTILTSATMDDGFEQIAPNMMIVDIKDQKIESLQEIAYITEAKLEILPSIFTKHNITRTILFCNTIERVKEVSQELMQMGINNKILHKELSLDERIETLELFKNGSLNIIVASDIIGRGIDIDNLDSIINIDIPKELERYKHRVGRVARAGKDGIAISIIFKYESQRLQKLNSSIDIYDDIEICDNTAIKTAINKTIKIDGGKNKKISKSDILGAFMATNKISYNDIKNIKIYDKISYIAINSLQSVQIYTIIKNLSIKQMKLRKWLVE